VQSVFFRGVVAELSAELRDLCVQLIQPGTAPGGVSADPPEGQSCSVLSELLLQGHEEM